MKFLKRWINRRRSKDWHRIIQKTPRLSVRWLKELNRVVAEAEKAKRIVFDSSSSTLGIKMAMEKINSCETRVRLINRHIERLHRVQAHACRKVGLFV